jgi:molybdopterin converting factor small subunit
MVLVKFFNLIRSKYQIKDLELNSGTLGFLIDTILMLHPHIEPNDLKEAVIFINDQQVMHLNRFNVIVKEGDLVVFTHFVGGG